MTETLSAEAGPDAHQEIFRTFADGLASRLQSHPAARIRLIAAR